MNSVSLRNPMLDLLDQINPTYQPEGMAKETGDPATSLVNVRTLLREGFTFLTMLAGLGGILFIFQTGEMLLATGLSLGGGPKTEALAQIAEEIGLGCYEERLSFYTSLQNYSGPVPN